MLNLEIPTISIVGSLVKEGIPVLIYRYIHNYPSTLAFFISSTSTVSSIVLVDIKAIVKSCEQWGSRFCYSVDWKPHLG